MLVRAELTLGYGQVMELVMTALHHDAHEPKTLNFNDLLGISAGDGELDPVRQVLCCRAPARLRQFVRMRWNHALDGVERSAFTGDCDLKAVIEFAFARDSLEGDLIHVDEVLAQSVDVYL